MKYLKDKPVNSLRDEQFLKLFMAEEEKLLELDIGSKITNYSGQNYVDEAKGLYARVRLCFYCYRVPRHDVGSPVAIIAANIYPLLFFHCP